MYDGLDELLDRLMAAHGTRRGAGFVLTVYRRRLTSSWAAMRRTLERRLARDHLVLDEDADLLDEAEDFDLDTGDRLTVDDAEAVPLSADDLQLIQQYLEDLGRLPDAKFDRLTDDLNEARGAARPVIVFTQFADTLQYLRDRLHASYRSHLATYSGAGGQVWLESEGWVALSKRELVEALWSGRVSVILATDAASEGLNLQVASYLINYDLPWNPMRVEQRIGRLDRIGQRAPVVTVRNYVIPGTVEESVYQALATRIDLFGGIVGRLQPILGATEDTFRRVFRTPHSERKQEEEIAIEELLAKVDELERSGIDLGDEDALPIPDYPASRVTLDDLRTVLADELDVQLDQPGRPTTFAADRVSRDSEQWCALATYGHPEMEHELRRRAGPEGDSDALIIREVRGKALAYRADRTPPQRIAHVTDLAGLGSPTSTGEAAERALQEAEAAARDAEERKVTVERARLLEWETGIKRRFRQLVVTAVNAEGALRLRRNGEPADPILLWLDLLQGQGRGWQSADTFRQWLGMEVAELLPIGPAGKDDRNERELSRVRATTDQALVDLISKWRAVALKS